MSPDSKKDEGAPAEIWFEPGGWRKARPTPPDELCVPGPWTRYVRADIYQGALAEIERLLEVAEDESELSNRMLGSLAGEES